MKHLALALALVLVASDAFAWPTSLVQCLVRDARRLVPRSLARLLYDREDKVLEEAQHFPADLSQTLFTDLSSGDLKPATLDALEAHASASLPLFKELRVSEGIVRLGATLRIPADLSDPALASGPEGFPAGVTREYYAFVEANLDRLPVVLDDAAALKLKRKDLPDYWRSLVLKSRAEAPVLRSELFRAGRVVDHRSLDWHSPVFAVAEVSYSRAVTGIAATWLAVWRDARGDMTLMKAPAEVAPSDRPPEGPTP